jgi:hypothetical protein
MSIYDNAASLATRILASDKGGDIVIRREVGGFYNTVTGADSGSTTTDYPTRGAWLNFVDSVRGDFSLVINGDRLLVLNNSVAPFNTDLIVDGSDLLTVVQVVEKAERLIR